MTGIFDSDLIANRKLSLEEGAIRGWDKRNSYYFQMLSCLAKHFKLKEEKEKSKNERANL